jgi:hypothetical protein
MSELAYRLAVWIPTSIAVWMLVWYAGKQLAAVTGAPSIRRRVEAWPLASVVVAAALFGVIAGSLGFALGENTWGRLLATVVAAFVSTAVVERLWPRPNPHASQASDASQRSSRGDE